MNTHMQASERGEEPLEVTQQLVRVAEVAGPTYAGHGHFAGTPVHLLRLGMCNLACEWCEAPATVAALGAELDRTAPYYSVANLLKHWLLQHLDADAQVPLLITGGEPLLQDMAILDLAQRLTDSAPTTPLWCETNGTKPVPPWWRDWIHHTVVSPKVGTTDAQHKRLTHALPGWVELASEGMATIDFCVATRSDVASAAMVCDWHGLSPSACTLTPRGGTFPAQQNSLNHVHAAALTYGFRLTPRPLLEHRIVQ